MAHALLSICHNFLTRYVLVMYGLVEVDLKNLPARLGGEPSLPNLFLLKISQVSLPIRWVGDFFPYPYARKCWASSTTLIHDF